jgi:hypothetical protein
VTIDERIEALTQSVDLLAHMHQDKEKRYNLMFERLASMNERLISMNERLVDIAEDREGRIRRLENNGE